MSNQSQSISLMQATTMGMNIMIGAGVLSGPAVMALGAGSISFLGWVLATIVMLPIVYNVARLPEAIPGAGGMYLYCRQGLGRTGGFLGGWLYLLAYNCSVMVILSAFRNAFLSAYPNFWLLKSKFIFLAVCLAGIYLFNMLSARTAARIQSQLTYFKLIPIISAILLLPFFWRGSSFTIDWTELPKIGKAIPLALFGFIGFEYCCNISHLVQGGARAAKNAILAGFVSVSVIYALFHYSVLSIMGVQGLIAHKASGFSSFVAVKFPWIAIALAIILPVSTIITYLNSSNGLIFLDGILMQSLADDKLLRFSEKFAELNRNGRPWISVLVSALSALLVGSAIDNIDQLASNTNVCVFLLVAIAIVGLLKTEADKPFDFNKFMAYFGMIVSLGIAIFSWLQMGSTIGERIVALWPALAGLVLGLLLYRPQGQVNDHMANPENLDVALNK